jgi:hypothetical protein
MDWMFRGGVSRRYFPEQWEELVAGVPEELRGLDVVEAYSRLLEDPDPAVRERGDRLVHMGVGDARLAALDRARGALP